MTPIINRRIHISWLIASLCLGVVVGVIAVLQAPRGFFAAWVWLLVGLVLAGLALWQRRMWLIPVAILAGLTIGLWRGSFGQLGMSAYDNLIGSEVVVSGQVLEDPDVDKRGQLLLRLGKVSVSGDELPGSVWVSTKHTDAIKRSDIVTVKGKASDGFGSFAMSVYRAEVVKVERPVPGDVAVGVRDWFADRVRAHIPETEAALGLGFLMGLRRALPPGLAEALQIAGLTHVIVASGYNLTILVRLARRLFVRVSKYLSMLTSVAMILSFMAMTGMSPSMSRAGLVAGLSLAAWYYGRKIHPLVLLPLAASVTLLINPQYGWNDLGWQLSFASFAGVIILAPLIQRYFFGDKKPGLARQIFGETFSAYLVTLPLLVMTFGVMSNVSLVANMLVLPLVPLAMLLTFLVGVLSSVPVVAELIAAPTAWLLQYMTSVAEWLSSQNWAQTELSIGWPLVIMIYGLLILSVWWMQRQTKLNLREANIVE